MKDTLIADLKPGDRFHNLIAARSGVEWKEAANGPFLAMTLSDCSGRRSARKFQATLHEREMVFASQFVCVSGAVEAGQYSGQLKIDAVRAWDTPVNMNDFLPPRPHDYKKQQLRFACLVKSVQEPNLGRLLRLVFDAQQPTWKQFCNAFAAKSIHHAYGGGLLEHSAEVAELCDRACAVIPALRRDFLVTGALLHDIGKLDEMEHGLNAGEFTDAGTLEGHVILGAFRIRQAAESLVGFPANLKLALSHLILSHHGLPEFGAAKTPACAEAVVLAQCDMISARVHEFHQAAAPAAAGQIAVRLTRTDGGRVYVGDLGLQEPPVKPVVVEPVMAEPALTFATNARAEPELTTFTTRFRVMGLVAAGAPEQSSEEDEETREAIAPVCGADYLLRVTGESIIGAGILDGDLVFVKTQETAADGDIVIAHLAASGQIVKRLRRSGADGVWLDSENPSPHYAPIPFTEDTRIQGKVVGLLRDF